MKRLFSILAIACIMAFGTANATTNANTRQLQHIVT